MQGEPGSSTSRATTGPHQYKDTPGKKFVALDLPQPNAACDANDLHSLDHPERRGADEAVIDRHGDAVLLGQRA